MPARLSPTYEEAVLWQDQAPPPALAPGPLPAEADVVVVGAGYAGLSAARELAQRGRSVVVLDAEPIGWGASTRNGGMVIPELKAGPAALTAAHGPLGGRLYSEVNEAFDHLEGLVAGPDGTAGKDGVDGADGADGIECDYRRTGQLFLAHAPRLVPSLRAMAREHAEELGEPVRFVERDRLADEIGSAAYHGGVVFDRTGAVHPAKLHGGLVHAASAAGAALHGSTRATAITRQGSGSRVTTPTGSIEARHVVVMTNAYADGLLPDLRRRVVPVGSFIIATEVLDPDLARAVSPRNRMLVDTKNFLFYWRLTPDGRMLFGGRRSLAASTVPQARDFLYDSMVAVHPQLAGVSVERAWGGYVAITLDRLPHVGRIDGAWYATGCNGSGVALNCWLGARIGEHLCGDAELPSFAELTHRPIPAHRFRNAYLPLVGLWFRWQDRGFRPSGDRAARHGRSGGVSA